MEEEKIDRRRKEYRSVAVAEPSELDREIGKRIEDRSVETITPDFIKHPDIRAGVCEYCGVHWSNCAHYRGLDVKCTFCGNKEMMAYRNLKVQESKKNPGVLTMICSDYRCMQRYWNRQKQ